MRKFLLSAGVAAISALASAAAIAGPAITVTAPGWTYDSTLYTLGFSFTVGTATTITELGVYDENGDGLANAASVGLWAADGSLLRSATVGSGLAGSLVGLFRYASITPFTATPGITYVVGAYLAQDTATSLGTGQDGAGSVDPNIIIAQDRYSNFDSAFGFPSVTDGFAGGAWLGANFITGTVEVPEPTSLALLGAGLLGLAATRRARRPAA